MKNPARKSLGFQMMLAARLYRARMAALLGGIGLFPGQEQALQSLGAEDGATMGDLARVLRVRPPTISKTIARLSQQGLVERRMSADDARSVRVFLTDQGRATLSHIDAAIETLEADIIESLEDKGAKRFKKALRRITRDMSIRLDPQGITGLDALIEADEDTPLFDEEA